MKITMYELLGMVKDGKAPKRIKVTGNVYEYDDEFGMYMCVQKAYKVALGGMKNEINLICNAFNEIVEILDDEDREKGLPEKINDWISAVGRVDDSNIEGYVHILFEQQTQLYCKINQFIDYLERQRKGE